MHDRSDSSEHEALSAPSVERCVDPGDASFPEHYEMLKKLARSRLRPHRTFTLLSTTELLHESYLRLATLSHVRQDDQPRFLAYAGQVMSSVIVDMARKKLTQRRGAGASHVEMDESWELFAEQPAREIIQVHEALEALESSEPVLAKVLALEYFAGMSSKEIGVSLGFSDRTVRRYRDKAHLILRVMLA